MSSVTTLSIHPKLLALSYICSIYPSDQHLAFVLQGVTSAPADVGRTNSSSAHAEVVGNCTPARSLGAAGRLRPGQPPPQHLREAVGEVAEEAIAGAEACAQDHVSATFLMS